MIINIFIQARMSSVRFPGKILAPLNGKPIIKHMIDLASQIKDKYQVVVLTSVEESDDPLVSYLESIGCCYFRGSLNNVFERFQECAKSYACDYFVRICADSPFLNTKLVEVLLEYVKQNHVYDIISNVFNRTFPKGQSVEIIRSDTFLDIEKKLLTNYECEHVTPYLYSNQQKFKTMFVNYNKNLAHINMSIDSIEDLRLLNNSNCFDYFDARNICTIK